MRRNSSMACRLNHLPLLVLSVLCVVKAVHGKLGLLVLGDSMSDQGNLFNLTHGSVPMDPPYWNGRSTNAPGVWADYLADSSYATADIWNLAYAGSTACSYPPSHGSVQIPSLQDQVQMFVEHFPNSPWANASEYDSVIALIWSGHNDILQVVSNPNSTSNTMAGLPSQISDCISNATSTLLGVASPASRHVSGVMLTTLAPLDLVPAIRNTSYAQAVKPLEDSTIGYVMQIVTNTTCSNDNNSTGLPVYLWDANKNFTDIVVNYKQLGFKSNHNCVVSKGITSKPTFVCSNPDDYTFFDGFHPSSAMHKILAGDIADAFNTNALHGLVAPP